MFYFLVSNLLCVVIFFFFFFFSSRRRHTRWPRDWSSDVCSSDLALKRPASISLADKVPLRSKIRVGPSCTRISELCRLHFCGNNLWSVPQPDLVIPRTFGFSRRISPCRDRKSVV